MQIILKGKKSIKKLLQGRVKVDTLYRPSIFLLFKEIEDGLLICNTMTGEMLLLNSFEAALLSQLPMYYSSSFLPLINAGLIVPVNNNEIQTSEQFRILLLRRCELKKHITRFNILPTTSCNARCFYCYESGIQHIQMSEETASQVVKFIKANHGGNKVDLCWFGGEPMLGKQRIDQICRELEENRIEFESEMVSNAYLFDSELVKHAQKEWKLKSIQITLDGTEKIYNQTKSYVNPVKSPFQKVKKNIESFMEVGIHVDIRLNLDWHNAEDLHRLIEELSVSYKDRNTMTVFVRRLNEGTGFEPIQLNQSEKDYLDQKLIDLQELLETRGWPQYKVTHLPNLSINSCMADDPYNIQCTPDGILSKCEDQIFNHSVGTLESGVVDREEVLWWQQKQIFEGCEKCSLYPSCRRLLRNCPVTSKCSEYEKSKMIEKYYEIMVEEYHKWKHTSLREQLT